MIYFFFHIYKLFVGSFFLVHFIIDEVALISINLCFLFFFQTCDVLEGVGVKFRKLNNLQNKMFLEDH